MAPVGWFLLAIALLVPTVLAQPDTQPPVTLLEFDGPLVAGDEGASWIGPATRVVLWPVEPVLGTAYSLDDGAPQAYAGPFLLPTAGLHTLRYWSTDSAGNVEDAKIALVGLDGEAPALEIEEGDDVVLVHWLVRGDDDAWRVSHDASDATVVLPAPVRFPGEGTTYVGPTGASVLIAADATDARGVSRVGFAVTDPRGDPFHPCADDVQAPYECRWSATTQQPGEYTFTVTAWDALGNAATAEGAFTLWWDPVRGGAPEA